MFVFWGERGGEELCTASADRFVFVSLLSEYHDLYELQRKRLEAQVGELKYRV